MLYRPKRQWPLASFIPRLSSQHARAAGIRFVDTGRPDPATLVLAGPAASGKTHLLHALTHHARKNHAIADSACLSASQWAQDVVWAQYHDDLQSMVQRFSQYKLLALDDIDRLWGMPTALQAMQRVITMREALPVRTLLTATLYQSPVNLQPVSDWLNCQRTVRLW
ncbi:MAG: ATP-binding protein [Rhodoferax sp.]|nr:ATP-binding protein [Rhodoferax sp.]